MRRMLLAVVFFAAAAAVCGADWYAAPDGTADGTGSIERPWDLATALGHPPAVEPGDVINLRGGTYRGGELLVPMGMPESIAVPVGWDKRLIEPDVRFGCFVVQRVAAVARRSVREELDDHERRIRALETK